MTNSSSEACFIDTNDWLYAFVESDQPEKTAAARELIKATQPFISTQVINEVCVNLIQKAHFNERQISKLIKSFFQKYEVVEVGKEIMLSASSLRQGSSFSFWDSTIVAAALMADTTILYSEDFQDGLLIHNRLRIINPFANK